MSFKEVFFQTHYNLLVFGFLIVAYPWLVANDG